jgi:hypothetical protein
LDLQVAVPASTGERGTGPFPSPGSLLIFAVVPFQKSIKITLGDRGGENLMDQQIDYDQADDEILIYTVSDEALEASTGMERSGSMLPLFAGSMTCCID